MIIPKIAERDVGANFLDTIVRMSPALASITVNVLSNFITDALKWLAGGEANRLQTALDSTANAFPGIEGVQESLRQWLKIPDVIEVLQSYVEGKIGSKDLAISDLAKLLVDRTQFYLPNHSEATAKKIISTFLTKVRHAYLSDPQIGMLHIANRQDAGFGGLQLQMQEIATSIETSGGLKPSLQKHFESAVELLKKDDYPSARALFESLLTELHSAPIKLPELERNIHANLANITAKLGDNKAAGVHYGKAAELDENPVRKAVNGAVGHLIEQKFEEAEGSLSHAPEAEAQKVFEYWSARVWLLIGLKRFDEAIAAAVKCDITGKEGERQHLVGLACRATGNLEEAEKAFRAAVAINGQHPEFLNSLAEVLMVAPIEFRNAHHGLGLPEKLEEKAGQAATYLISTSAILKSQGRLKAALEVDSNLALVRILQTRFPEAIAVLESIVRESPDVAANWRMLGFAYLATNNPAKAAEAFGNAIKRDPDSDTEYMDVQALIMSGQAESALNLLAGRATYPVSLVNLRWHLAKVQVFSSKRQYAKAEEILKEVQIAFPHHPEVLLNVAELRESTGNSAEAAVAFAAALQNATGDIEFRVRFQYGAFCFNRKEFPRAVELWKPLVRALDPNTLLDNFMVALYQSQNLAEVASIANKLKGSKKSISALFADVAAAANERLSNLNEAREWLEFLGDRYGNRPKHIVRLANIHLRLGHREQAIELLDATRASLTQPKELAEYAQTYSILGRHQDALELAFRAAQMKESPDIHFTYVGVFLATRDDIERTPEQIALFQDILGHFQERFPEAGHIQSYKVDPENPIDAIRETLTKLAQRTQDAVRLYKEKRPPLTVFARILGRDLYETWLRTVADPDLALFTSTGTDEDSNESQRLLSTVPGLIVEPVALFTLAFVGLIDRISKVGDVHVAQHTLDLLHELQAKRTLTALQTATMGMIDGEFFFHESDPDDVAKMNAALSTATEWVEKHANITGLLLPFAADEEKWITVLGDADVASLAIAKQREIVLLTDDRPLADIGKLTHGIAAINTQSTLLYLRVQGHITPEEYDRAILKLAEAGYSFTQLEDSQFFRLIVDEQFQLTPRLKRLFRFLESPGVALSSGCFVVAGIFCRLFLEPIPTDMRETIAFFMLDSLAISHPKLEVQRHICTFVRQQLSPVLSFQLAAIEDLLNRW